jgi:nucleotide-binding universal stress UspA family protein
VETLYDRMLVAIDASPDSPDNSLNRTIQFAKMSGATVYLLHVARGHLIPADISAGSRLGVPTVEDDADVRERQVVQNAVDQIAAAGVEVHGEMIEATEHDVADVIVQRAKELEVDLIVLGYQHYRGSAVAQHVVRQEPHCSILLARPPAPALLAGPREPTQR